MAHAKWKRDGRGDRAAVIVARWRDPAAPGRWCEERRPNDRTLAQARAYAQERERRAERIAKGLEVEAQPITCGELLDEWWEREGRRRRSESKHDFWRSVGKHFGHLRGSCP